MRRYGKRLVLGAILVALLAAGALLTSLRMPYRGFGNEAFLTIDRGTGAVAIGRQLAQAGVIRYAWQFWAERALHGSQKLQAGEYRFSDPETVASVFGRIARGDVYFFEFTVPEGSSIFDIARLLDQGGIMHQADFLAVASNPAIIRDLAPSAPSLEGYLFPSTYRLTHSTTPAQLCREMTAQFRKVWHKLAEGKPANVHRTVTLASMVEKETGVAGERPLIAGVFFNRLEQGMKLDCDPTTIYAAELDNRFRGVIHKSDLASRNPYNTYQHEGLPPGPIANPGLGALEAALAPAQTDYLYFVAKPGGGGHNFSTTLAGHERATRLYRNKADSKNEYRKKTGKAE